MKTGIFSILLGIAGVALIPASAPGQNFIIQEFLLPPFIDPQELVATPWPADGFYQMDVLPFDDQGGTRVLTRVNLALYGVATSEGTLTVNNPAGFDVDVQTGAYIAAFLGDYGDPNYIEVEVYPVTYPTSDAIELPQFVSYGSYTLDTTDQSVDEKEMELTSGALFDRFKGPNTLTFQGYATSTAVYQENAGNFSVVVTSKAYGRFTVTYEWAPVPEPSLYASVFGLGLLGFAGYRRMTARA